MTTIQKVNRKLDVLADQAKDGAEMVAEKIVDAANDVAHAAAEKLRQGTENVGEKMIDAGKKISKMAK